MRLVGKVLAKRLNQAPGPLAVIIPKLGFSRAHTKGDPTLQETVSGFVSGLVKQL